MIEFTTGVVFLMSSLYGAGQANANLANATAAVQSGQATTTIVSTLNYSRSPKDIEAYIRQKYADTPILIDIARCESNFHQFNGDGTVVRGVANKQDVGIMQINERYHADEALKLGFDIYTTTGNIAFGKYLYTKYGTEPWNFSSKCWTGDIAKK